MVTVLLGLGTNLGLREKQLQRAVDALRTHIANLRCSPVYESRALLPPHAPQEWDMPFLNMALRGETELSAPALLQEIKRIEREIGRVKLAHWGPREIDIDILAYNDDKIVLPDLTVPHAHLLARDFVLVPLADVAPHWLHPDAGGKTLAELARAKTARLSKTSWVIA